MLNPEEENNELEEQDDELYEHHKFIAEKGQNPLRVDKYLMNYIEKATRNKIQKAAKSGNIYVNEVPVKSNYKVKAGDVVQVMFEHPPYEFLLTPEDIPLDVVYEDDDPPGGEQTRWNGGASRPRELQRNSDQRFGISF